MLQGDLSQVFPSSPLFTHTEQTGDVSKLPARDLERLRINSIITFHWVPPVSRSPLPAESALSLNSISLRRLLVQDHYYYFLSDWILPNSILNTSKRRLFDLEY